VSDLEARIVGLLAAARDADATDGSIARSIVAEVITPELAKPCNHSIDVSDLGDLHVSDVMRVLRAVGLRLIIDYEPDTAEPAARAGGTISA
jgi:hypothetical protein